MILSFGQTSLGNQCTLRSHSSRRSSLIRVYTVWYSSIFWMCYSMVKPHYSNFRIITAVFLVVSLPTSKWHFIPTQVNIMITEDGSYLGEEVSKETVGCVGYRINRSKTDIWFPATIAWCQKICYCLTP